MGGNANLKGSELQDAAQNAGVSMQEEYASQPRDGKLAGLYAQKIRSAPARQDGLYWKVGDAERPSPMGDLVSEASAEGATISES